MVVSSPSVSNAMLLASFQSHLSDLLLLCSCLCQVHLREILRGIAVYNTKNPHKNMWELKGHLRRYEDDTKQPSASSWSCFTKSLSQRFQWLLGVLLWDAATCSSTAQGLQPALGTRATCDLCAAAGGGSSLNLCGSWARGRKTYSDLGKCPSLRLLVRRFGPLRTHSRAWLGSHQVWWQSLCLGLFISMLLFVFCTDALQWSCNLCSYYSHLRCSKFLLTLRVSIAEIFTCGNFQYKVRSKCTWISLSEMYMFLPSLNAFLFVSDTTQWSAIFIVSPIH